MDNPIGVSVVIVSRNRPTLLTRCLRGLSQLYHRNFEIIVVADPAGLAAVRDLKKVAPIKTCGFDIANISRARNIGLAAAAGDVVAFIDDDAVPEPTWLTHLTAPFQESDVAAAGGFVRGRNGISFQWAASTVDASGCEQPLKVALDRATVFTPSESGAIKTQGTNCAFRRSVLIELGGFDPAYAFFLDETDVNMRLARAGLATAVVPMAQVHHGFAASALRSAARVPRDLTLVGASLAVFHRKFAKPDQARLGWEVFRARQRKRLLAHMVSGGLEPWQVGRLLQSLDAGYQQRDRPEDRADAAAENLAGRDFPAPPPPFLRLTQTEFVKPSRVIAGRSRQAKRLRAEAAQSVKDGHVTSLFLFSPTTLYHRVRFSPDGYWEQQGGQFGKSLRSDRLISFSSFKQKLQKEQSRVEKFR